MSNVKIPSEWNGKPTDYLFFDGFMKAGIIGKVLYVLGFPLVSILMEGYRYNVASTNKQAAMETLEKQSHAASPMDGLNSAASIGTHFQDKVTQSRQNFSERAI